METQKSDFFQKRSKFNFDFCRRAEINIQVGLKMHLYDNIGIASSSSSIFLQQTIVFM